MQCKERRHLLLLLSKKNCPRTLYKNEIPFWLGEILSWETESVMFRNVALDEEVFWNSNGNQKLHVDGANKNKWEKVERDLFAQLERNGTHFRPNSFSFSDFFVNIIHESRMHMYITCIERKWGKRKEFYCQ